MKKFTSICLSLVMLLSLFPIGAFAAENTQSEYDQLIALAREVFPEYSAAIQNTAASPSINSRSISNPTVVSKETRRLSDTEALTVALLSSGEVIVISTDDVTISKYGESVTENEDGITGRVSFRVAAYGCLFKLSEVKFTIENYSTCYFTSPGTVAQSTFISWNRHQYTSTSLIYTLKFGSISTQFFKFRLYFSNSQLIADID